MGNGPPTIEFEDGTVDVEHLLVEPQDGHVSVDSVMCFNEKISEKAIDIREVSRTFGVTSAGTAHEGGDILNRDVLDLHTEDDSGYFRLQNDFCSMGEEYLLGVGFAESITDLEYVSSECLQTSVSDSPVLTCAGIDSPWKSDIFRIMEVPECQNEVVDLKNSEFGEIPRPQHESENLTEKKPLKSPKENIGKVHDISRHSFDDLPSDENATSLPQPVKMFSGPKNEKSDEYVQTGQSSESNRVHRQDESITLLSAESPSDALPVLKRSRKPTKRYIDEVVDPISRHSKRRREVSSSAFREKSVGVKDNKKCHMGSKAIKLPAEESAVKAIQVPFGSLVRKECPESPAYNLARSSDRRILMNKPKDYCVASENQKKRDECTPVVHQIKWTDGIPAASQKKKDDNVSGAHSMKKDQYITNIHSTKRNDSVTAASQKKKEKDVNGAHLVKSDDRLTAPSQKTREQTGSPKKKDECTTAICQRKREDPPTVESPEEVSGRRKHHRLWTIAEVKKLIDGVAEYGVGRWSRIKKIYFPASAHRTSVDLKDKWRNLLKASGLQGQHNEQGEKKRNVAWRPLPKSILRRVCELAAMHPYPKGGKPKMAHIRHVSPDKSTDITLSDYRRILRSINGS
ncbi:uncharacterized protein LOC130997762 isoform X2 [Salvia miltiorrhiza]|uniref:uncharacterized protein LOC130997762 isoform X2 n=1 Tax=Salvia miltiorrhiza TaxID=226208 RepID=UPI0025AD1F47|nr:uncharacterized protein LOC130997762 isoform X2 [Salvia miltiorrhiza]XP_057779174.1 uncharacterized protein LOC130997762 isoform X2 [Salvia miltiorrhiza]